MEPKIGRCTNTPSLGLLEKNFSSMSILLRSTSSKLMSTRKMSSGSLGPPTLALALRRDATRSFHTKVMFRIGSLPRNKNELVAAE